MVDKELRDILMKHGYNYHDHKYLKIRFTEDELKYDVDNWNNYGREHLKSLILPIIPIYDL